MSYNFKPAEILSAAKRLIVSGGLSKHAKARDTNGLPVWYGSPRAVSFSLQGAVQRAVLDATAVPAAGFAYHDAYREAYHYLRKGMEVGTPEEFDSYESSTADDAVGFLNTAVEVANAR